MVLTSKKKKKRYFCSNPSEEPVDMLVKNCGFLPVRKTCGTCLIYSLHLYNKLCDSTK